MQTENQIIATANELIAEAATQLPPATRSPLPDLHDALLATLCWVLEDEPDRMTLARVRAMLVARCERLHQRMH